MRAFILLVVLSGAPMASAECRLMADLYEVPAEVEVPGRAPIEVTFHSEQLVELLPGDRFDGIRFRTTGPAELEARLLGDRPVIIAVYELPGMCWRTAICPTEPGSAPTTSSRSPELVSRSQRLRGSRRTGSGTREHTLRDRDRPLVSALVGVPMSHPRRTLRA